MHRVLFATLLSTLALALPVPTESAEAQSFQGVVVAIDGSIAEVDPGSGSDDRLYVRAPGVLSEDVVGKTVSGECIMRGDLCTATDFNIEE